MTDSLDKWREVHQEFEIDYHRKDNYRWHDEQFIPAWRQNFREFLGLEYDTFSSSDILLDVGSGSRPCLPVYFERGIIFNIDPLCDRYLEIPQVRKYWPPELWENAISHPAETLVQELFERCSFIICWNVLDHCFDWRAVLRNILSYAKPSATIAICTDLKSHGEGHPGIDDPAALFEMLFASCKIEKLEINYGQTVVRDVAIKLRSL